MGGLCNVKSHRNFYLWLPFFLACKFIYLGKRKKTQVFLGKHHNLSLLLYVCFSLSFLCIHIYIIIILCDECFSYADASGAGNDVYEFVSLRGAL